MLHPFWLNPFYKITILISLTCLSGKAFSKDPSPIPGIIESFERLLTLHKEQYQKNKIKINSNLNSSIKLSDFTDVKIDPDYMKSILFHSAERFLILAQKNECNFLASLETNLLKTADQNVDKVLITYTKKDGTTESASMLKDDFVEQTYKKKCLNNREYSILFNDTNLQKTFKGIKFSLPKNKNECDTIHREWLDNPFLPYLCRIQQDLANHSDNKQVPLMEKIYLENLCNSIDTPELFCANYLKNDVWSKILNSEIPQYKMSYKCQQMLNKKTPLSNAELKNCAAKLNNDSTFCETSGNRDYPSNFPLQNCNNLSATLSKSKLITLYHDCPGNIENMALTNIHRIVNHFDPRKIISDKTTCSSEASYTFARLNMDVKHETGWPLKICYLNRVDNKEACVPYIPGARSEEPLGEDQVVAKILYQQKGAGLKTTCRIVDAKSYNPLRSEFKYGCFIVEDTENCTVSSCNKKVIWEEKEMRDFKFIGVPIFDYFPSNFTSEQYSFIGLVDEVKKTKNQTIRNLTTLKSFLDQNPNGIIHGVGCAEDLSPEQFRRVALNQCRPMPFIIDGYLEKSNEVLLISRMAIDDLHTPHFLTWPRLFNAVTAHQALQPINIWTLNGIKK